MHPSALVHPRRRPRCRPATATPRALARFAFAGMLLFSVTSCTQPTGTSKSTAKVLAGQQVSDRLIDLTVDSPALGGTEQVRLLVPDGWTDRAAGETWPVLYLLDGGGGEHDAWTNDGGVAELDELRDTLVVMPGMPLFGFYTNWYNEGDGGPPAVETFHLDELSEILERDYAAGANRVVAGLSQGGYGALVYAAHRPGMFRAAASYSGWVHPLQRPDLVLKSAELAGTMLADGPIDGSALWGNPVTQRAVWQANDPYYLAEQLKGTKIYIASGNGRIGPLDPPDLARESTYPELDRFGEDAGDNIVDPTEALMQASSRAVLQEFTMSGVPVTEHFYAGTHSWPYWQRELQNSLPMLLDALK